MLKRESTSNPIQTSDSTIGNANSKSTSTEPSSIWAFHRQLQADQNANRNENLNINSEITLYRNEQAIFEQNPLLYWAENGKKFLRLRLLALDYLVILATSVPSERLFSKAGLILTDQRSSLKSKHLEKLLFLNSLPS